MEPTKTVFASPLVTSRVFGSCFGLDALQCRYIVCKILDYATLPAGLRPGEALCVWTFDMLKAHTKLSDLALLTILEAYERRIQDYAQTLWAAYVVQYNLTARSLPEFKIGIVDDKYAVAAGVRGFLNLQNGLPVDALPYPPLHTDVFSLDGLWVQRAQTYAGAIRLDNFPHGD